VKPCREGSPWRPPGNGCSRPWQHVHETTMAAAVRPVNGLGHGVGHCSSAGSRSSTHRARVRYAFSLPGQVMRFPGSAPAGAVGSAHRARERRHARGGEHVRVRRQRVPVAQGQRDNLAPDLCVEQDHSAPAQEAVGSHFRGVHPSLPQDRLGQASELARRRGRREVRRLGEVVQRPNSGKPCAWTPAANSRRLRSGIGAGQEARASGPARPAVPREWASRFPDSRRADSGSSSSRSRPTRALRIRPAAPGPPRGRVAVWPASSRSVFEPKTEISTSSGKKRISPSWPSRMSS